MRSQQTNHLTKPNNRQQKTNIPHKSAYSYRYLRTYFKRARPSRITKRSP